MRSSSYSNTQSFVYPFTCTVPFPVGIIKNIKIALKISRDIPFISALVKTEQVFTIQISTKQKVLGSFIDQGDTFINLNNDQIYGFIQLGVYPPSNMNYTGQFNIHKSCYTYSVPLQGLKQLEINNKKYKCEDILKVSVSGDCQIVQDVDCITISRSKDSLYDYFQKQPKNIPYIVSIDNVVCQQLHIEGMTIDKDNIIQVDKPVLRNQKNYVLYIRTSQNFPTCEQQRRDT